MAYQRSKLANILFAVELSKRVRADGIIVSALHPGDAWTNIVPVHVPGWLYRPSLWVLNHLFLEVSQGCPHPLPPQLVLLAHIFLVKGNTCKS